MQCNRAMYSTVEPKIRYENEKNVTVDDLVEEADMIWRKICAIGEPVPRSMRDISARNYKRCDDLLTTLGREHREFNKVYSIILKCACHNGMYNSGVFRRWVEKIRDNPWRGESEWIERMTEYLVSLYKTCFPRECAGKRATLMTKNIGDLLKGEHEALKKASVDAEKTVETMVDRLEQSRVHELADFIRAVGCEGIDAAMTTRIEIDPRLTAKLPAGISVVMPRIDFVDADVSIPSADSLLD